MSGQVIRQLLQRNNIPGSMIDDLILGCAYPEGEPVSYTHLTLPTIRLV